MDKYNEWWFMVGSGIAPKSDDDIESHAMNVSSVAWADAVTSFISFMDFPEDIVTPEYLQCKIIEFIGSEVKNDSKQTS